MTAFKCCDLYLSQLHSFSHKSLNLHQSMANNQSSIPGSGTSLSMTSSMYYLLDVTAESSLPLGPTLACTGFYLNIQT